MIDAVYLRDLTIQESETRPGWVEIIYKKDSDEAYWLACKKNVLRDKPECIEHMLMSGVKDKIKDNSNYELISIDECTVEDTDVEDLVKIWHKKGDKDQKWAVVKRWEIEERRAWVERYINRMWSTLKLKNT